MTPQELRRLVEERRILLEGFKEQIHSMRHDVAIVAEALKGLEEEFQFATNSWKTGHAMIAGAGDLFLLHEDVGDPMSLEEIIDTTHPELGSQGWKELRSKLYHVAAWDILKFIGSYRSNIARTILKAKTVMDRWDFLSLDAMEEEVDRDIEYLSANDLGDPIRDRAVETREKELWSQVRTLYKCLHEVYAVNQPHWKVISDDIAITRKEVPIGGSTNEMTRNLLGLILNGMAAASWEQQDLIKVRECFANSIRLMKSYMAVGMWKHRAGLKAIAILLATTHIFVSKKHLKQGQSILFGVEEANMDLSEAEQLEATMQKEGGTALQARDFAPKAESESEIYIKSKDEVHLENYASEDGALSRLGSSSPSTQSYSSALTQVTKPPAAVVGNCTPSSRPASGQKRNADEIEPRKQVPRTEGGDGSDENDSEEDPGFAEFLGGLLGGQLK